MGDKLLSFLVITMDQKTNIDPSACDCRNDPNCLAAVIRRKSGGLRAHSFSATNANDWNVAIFGAHWNRNDNNKADLPWLRVDFKNLEERAKFGTRFKECRDLFDHKMKEYIESMTKMTIRDVS
jgi:hypothetical protein